MAALLEELNRHFDEDHLERLANHLDTDVRSAERGVQACLPLLIGALAHEADEHADELSAALDEDFDGSLLDNLKEVLQRSTKSGGTLADAASGVPEGYAIDRRSVDGISILDHLLGERRDAIEAGLSRAVSVQANMTKNLMETLAPIVMHATGRVQRRDDLDGEGLRDLLHTELGALEQSMSTSEDGALRSFLEAEADQDVLNGAEQFGRAALDSGVMQDVLTQPKV